MARRPKLGLIVPVHHVPFAETLRGARAAERVGFESLWVPDHLTNAAAPRAGVLECWTVLAALAASTERASIGPLVLTTPFRWPPLLAKQAATLDAIAPGRVVLGLGAGGFTYEATCAQLGFPKLSPGERVAHVEETIACVRALLAGDPARFEGRFARAEGARVWPRPAKPIPIVLAASRPRMLALAARAADGWNCPLPAGLESGLAELARLGRARETLSVSVFSIAVVAESEAAARRALERAGRGAQLFGDVESQHVFGGPERVRERLADLARRGAEEVVLDVRGLPVEEAIDLLAREVMPGLAA
jgi:alkanesulfonate monooxygenase SsuD/methylene tetrahydromethanopterin reductase-like flavin-dependent oxidoreductase (luciferase family)